MVSPEAINPLELPSVSLAERSQLPQHPVIYFAIDSEGVVQYIGRSINPRQRWMQHHRCNQLLKMGSVRIAYLFADADLLPAIEEALIQWWQPPLNDSEVEFESKGLRIVFSFEAPGIGDRIREYRKNSSRTLAELAAEAGISVPHWNRIENEKVGEVPLGTLRGIEKALGADLGVKFDD